MIYNCNKKALTIKDMHSDREYNMFCLFMTVLLCIVFCITFSINVKAAGFDYNNWLKSEKTKYPAGKYWNHVGTDKDNSEGYTDKPCSLHGVSGVDHVYGTGGCTCNHFADPGIKGTATYPAVWHYSASQCMGFANKLGYDMFGSTMWSRITSASDSNYKSNIKVGDILRINGHSTFVISRSNDNKVTVAECNYTSKDNGCLISWGREIDLSKVSGFEYYEHAQNYSSVMNGSATPAPSSAEETTEAVSDDYTGWKQSADGVNYHYYKNGKLLTGQWVTVNKKKYYLDSNGNRVKGLYEIKNKLYYFDDNGIRISKKWETVNGDTYYFGVSGHALAAQWLYKGNLLVYVKSNCKMAKGELVKISGSTYLFSAKGKRGKGFKKLDGKYYYCNAYGIIYKKRWLVIKNKKYYLQKSGVRAANKLVKIGKHKYYFDSKGVLVKNTEIEYNDKIYRADMKGRCKFVRDADDTVDNDAGPGGSQNMMAAPLQ